MTFFILLITNFLLVVHKDKVLIFVLNEHNPSHAHATISLKYIVGIILFFIKTLFLLASPLMSVFFIFYIHFHCNLNHGLCPRVHLCMHWLDGRSTVTWVFRLLPTCLVGDICGPWYMHWLDLMAKFLVNVYIVFILLNKLLYILCHILYYKIRVKTKNLILINKIML